MKKIDILGIDLGTTKSGIAIWVPETGECTILPNQDGQQITPSVVSFSADTGQAIVGRAAIQRMISDPDQVIYSVKRFIGRHAEEKWVGHDRQHVTYDTTEDNNQQVLIQVAGREWTPSQISAKVLHHLKENAQTALNGQPIKKAVISVPAYFNETQRRATKEAGELAGLFVPRIISEPTAAALAFGLGKKPETVAVYDLGGGTFDISVLEISHGLFRVKAIDGDTHLGGDDFDQAIVEWMAEKFSSQHPSVTLPVAEDESLRANLREAAKKAKIALSDTLEQPIHLPQLCSQDGQAFDLSLTLTRKKLEELIQPFIERSLQLVEQTFEAAGLEATEISQFLLVGGQTRTPAVRNALTKRYHRPLNTSVEPDEAVAQGTAMLAARLCGYLKDRINLWDAIPLSLGIELANGRMDVIIKANEPIPIEKWRKGRRAFTTFKDGQDSIRFNVYQGERPIAEDNTYIGELILPLPPLRAREPRINCLFKVDQNGILTVHAESATDGSSVKAVFTHGAMSAEEVQAKQQEAERHRQADKIKLHLLQLSKEVAEMRTTISTIPDQKWLEHLEKVEALIACHDVSQAESLFAKMKEMM